MKFSKFLSKKKKKKKLYIDLQFECVCVKVYNMMCVLIFTLFIIDFFFPKKKGLDFRFF